MSGRASSCTYVGAQHGEDGDVLRNFYAVVYRPEALNEFPWNTEQFDCVIFVCDPKLGRQFAEDVARDIVECNVDYVQTTGVDAERFHDLIDVARDKIPRRNFLNEDVIMTTWHEEAVTISEMVDVADSCFGGSDYVLLLVIGNDADLRAAVEEMQKLLKR